MVRSIKVRPYRYQWYEVIANILVQGKHTTCTAHTNVCAVTEHDVYVQWMITGAWNELCHRCVLHALSIKHGTHPDVPGATAQVCKLRHTRPQLLDGSYERSICQYWLHAIPKALVFLFQFPADLIHGWMLGEKDFFFFNIVFHCDFKQACLSSSFKAPGQKQEINTRRDQFIDKKIKMNRYNAHHAQLRSMSSNRPTKSFNLYSPRLG